MKTQSYRLPDGRVVRVDATAAKDEPVIGFELKAERGQLRGRIVDAVRCGISVAKREMQFCAGPETQVFHACGGHRQTLEKGDVSCFLVLRDQPVRDVDPHEEIECDFCREG
jgi:hypothetical protein